MLQCVAVCYRVLVEYRALLVHRIRHLVLMQERGAWFLVRSIRMQFFFWQNTGLLYKNVGLFWYV